MGHLIIPTALGAQVVSCDDVVDMTALIDDDNDTLTIDIIYGIFGAADKLLKANLVFTKGSSNSFTSTAVEYKNLFAKAVMSISGASGSASTNSPRVFEKVTASGLLVADAIKPVVLLKVTSAIT